MTSLLEIGRLDAFHGDFQALFAVDFAVAPGGTVALVGANGAGKSTLLRTLTGLVSRHTGSLSFAGIDLSGLSAHRIARLGIAMVPEGRRLFRSLSVEENLLMGTSVGRPGTWTLDRIYALFPVLRERRRSRVTALSGGQQQMVAIGRALLSNPRLLLCDEISLGLAPVVVEEIYAAFPEIRSEGCAIVIVEQDVRRALDISDDLVCLLEGRVALAGRATDIGFDDVSAAYMGTLQRIAP